MSGNGPDAAEDRGPWTASAYPRYSEAEYVRRMDALRAIMREAEAGVAVVAGHAAGRAEIQHLTNAPVRWESALVVPADGEPRMFVQLDNHAAGLAPWSVVPIEVSGPDLGGAVAAHVAGSARGHGHTIGLLGPMSARLAVRLRAGDGERPSVDLGPGFTRHRLVKGAEELAWTRWAATLCDSAVTEWLGAVEPGLREDELGARLEAAVMGAGGQVGICFLATASMDHGGTAVPRQAWARRVTAPGDLAMFELSGGFGGTTGQVLRTVALGADPPDHVRRLHDLADRIADDLVAAIRPGLAVAELERIGGAIDAAGLTIIDDLVHGYGGGYLPPHIRTPRTRRAPPPALTLEPGMLLVVQPNIVSADRRFGVQTGDLILVTEAGAERLHATPRGLLRAGRPQTE